MLICFHPALQNHRSNTDTKEANFDK